MCAHLFRWNLTPKPAKICLHHTYIARCCCVLCLLHPPPQPAPGLQVQKFCTYLSCRNVFNDWKTFGLTVFFPVCYVMTGKPLTMFFPLTVFFLMWFLYVMCLTSEAGISQTLCWQRYCEKCYIFNDGHLSLVTIHAVCLQRVSVRKTVK